MTNKFHQISIVHISDLHLKKVNKRSINLIKRINLLRPDIIFITGDIIDHPVKSMDNLRQSINLLNGLNSTLKTYAILGNTDLPYKDSIIHCLNATKIKVLFNEIDSISFGSQNINIMGLFYINNHDTAYQSLIKKASHRNTIILSHAPDIIYKLNNKNRKIKLVLSGHTHSGQIRIPGLGAIILPGECSVTGYHFYDLCWFSTYKNIQYGFLSINNTYLNVSSGLNVGSFRFFSVNEISRIKFFYQEN